MIYIEVVKSMEHKGLRGIMAEGNEKLHLDGSESYTAILWRFGEPITFKGKLDFLYRKIEKHESLKKGGH